MFCTNQSAINHHFAAIFKGFSVAVFLDVNHHNAAFKISKYVIVAHKL